MKLLIELADKLGIKAKILTEEDSEELAFIYAIEQGKMGEYIDTQEFLKNIRK